MWCMMSQASHLQRLNGNDWWIKLAYRSTSWLGVFYDWSKNDAHWVCLLIDLCHVSSCFIAICCQFIYKISNNKAIFQRNC